MFAWDRSRPKYARGPSGEAHPAHRIASPHAVHTVADRFMIYPFLPVDIIVPNEYQDKTFDNTIWARTSNPRIGMVPAVPESDGMNPGESMPGPGRNRRWGVLSNGRPPGMLGS